MVLLHKATQTLLDHMRVDLRCRNIGMPQELLNGPQIGPSLQEVAGKCVT
jgi:hypothetical protein